MEIGTWILVAILSITLFVFLIVGIILALRLIELAKEAQKVITTSQQIAHKADDVVDNIKGMTSVGGIVKTFANRVMEKQERRYAAEDAANYAANHAANHASGYSANNYSADTAAYAADNAPHYASGPAFGAAANAANSSADMNQPAGFSQPVSSAAPSSSPKSRPSSRRSKHITKASSVASARRSISRPATRANMPKFFSSSLSKSPKNATKSRKK